MKTVTLFELLVEMQELRDALHKLTQLYITLEIENNELREKLNVLGTDVHDRAIAEGEEADSSMALRPVRHNEAGEGVYTPTVRCVSGLRG